VVDNRGLLGAFGWVPAASRRVSLMCPTALGQHRCTQSHHLRGHPRAAADWGCLLTPRRPAHSPWRAQFAVPEPIRASSWRCSPACSRSPSSRSARQACHTRFRPLVVPADRPAGGLGVPPPAHSVDLWTWLRRRAVARAATPRRGRSRSDPWLGGDLHFAAGRGAARARAPVAVRPGAGPRPDARCPAVDHRGHGGGWPAPCRARGGPRAWRRPRAVGLGHEVHRHHARRTR